MTGKRKRCFLFPRSSFSWKERDSLVSLSRQYDGLQVTDCLNDLRSDWTQVVDLAAEEQGSLVSRSYNETVLMREPRLTGKRKRVFSFHAYLFPTGKQIDSFREFGIQGPHYIRLMQPIEDLNQRAFQLAGGGFGIIGAADSAYDGDA